MTELASPSWEMQLFKSKCHLIFSQYNLKSILLCATFVSYGSVALQLRFRAICLEFQSNSLPSMFRCPVCQAACSIPFSSLSFNIFHRILMRFLLTISYLGLPHRIQGSQFEIWISDEQVMYKYIPNISWDILNTKKSICCYPIFKFHGHFMTFLFEEI